MRHLPFAIAFLFAISVSAQLPSDLDKLEGSWFCKSCQQPTWSEWKRPSDDLLVNRTYAVRGADTTEFSRIEISLRDGKFTVLRQILPGKPTQTFRLTKSEPYEFFWENENLAAFQTCLKMEFYGAKRLVVRDENGVMDFRRKREKSIAINLGGQVGSNWNDVKSVQRAPDYQYHIPGEYDHQFKPGAEVALVLDLYSPNGALGCSLEFGLLQRQIGADGQGFMGQNYYVRKGSYQSTDTYVAIVPEVRLGAHRALTVSGGFYRGFSQKRTLDGSVTFANYTAPSSPEYQNAEKAGANQENGVLAGVSYRLPFPALASIGPEVYCRGMYSGTNLYVCSISTGLRFCLGAE